MKVLLTGGAGFTGSRVIPILLEKGHDVRCLVRPTSNLDRIPVDQVELARGSFEESDSFLAALRGVDVLINVASLGFGHGPALIERVAKSGVRRALFVSTTAIFTKLNAPSKAIRTVAENAIRESGLEYTIIRPTMIYGGPDDRNMCRLIAYLRSWPIVPVFGAGRCLQQPVFVGDVAAAAVSAAFEDRCIGQEYNISGASPLTYNEVIGTIARLLKKRRAPIHLPSGMVIALLRVAELAGLRLPVKAEQVQRLNEDKDFSHADAKRDFGYSPRSFEEGIRLEMIDMGLLGTSGGELG